jgi:hypothetical protein
MRCISALLKSATEQNRRNSCGSQPRSNDITFWENKIEIIDPTARDCLHWVIRRACAALLRTSRGEPPVFTSGACQSRNPLSAPTPTGLPSCANRACENTKGSQAKKSRGFPRRGFRGRDGPRSWRKRNRLRGRRSRRAGSAVRVRRPALAPEGRSRHGR